MAFDLDPSYKQVPERIADFKAKHPEGSLRCLDPSRPFWIETIDNQTYIVYAAAAYRYPEDPAPGVGVAWEPVPGKTPYTRLSELQNAETSAWGRAIVAVLASESKAVASAEDVRNRHADHQSPDLICQLCDATVANARLDREPMRAHLVEMHDYVRNEDGTVQKPKLPEAAEGGDEGEARTGLASPSIPDKETIGAVRARSGRG